MSVILKPFSWLLLFFYNITSSYGLALILFAIVVKLILFPVTLKSKKSMIQTTMLSGKMQQLQKQYGKDRERYNLEVQKLYEREKVNPMGGCLWSMIPLILLIGLYAIIREPLFHLMNVPETMIETVASLTGVTNTGAYPQIAMAQALNDPAILAKVESALAGSGANLFAMDFTFFGLNLSDIPNWKFWQGGLSWNSFGLCLLALVSAVVSFLSMKVSMATNKINKNQPGNDQADQMNKTMTWMMPFMSLWIGFTVPAGLTIYWISQYFITMLQEVICSKMLKKDYEAARLAAEERDRQEKEEEKKRKEEARLERARRLEEEKKNKGKKKSGPKDIEPDQEGINKDDSREGIRAYARGRAYIPNRFGGVTPYTDPSQLMVEKAKAEHAAKTKKKGSEPRPSDEKKEEVVETPVVEETVVTPAPVVEETAPAVEEVEVEVEEIEVEVEEVEAENKEEI